MNNNNDELDFYLKVTIYNKNMVFGPGVAKLMELVKEKGTLSEAYKNMEMSSSKAWKLLKEAENGLDTKLISTTTGGSGGGKSELTEKGEDLLRRYQSFNNELHDIAKALIEKHFNGDIFSEN